MNDCVNKPPKQPSNDIPPKPPLTETLPNLDIQTSIGTIIKTPLDCLFIERPDLEEQLEILEIDLEFLRHKCLKSFRTIETDLAKYLQLLMHYLQKFSGQNAALIPICNQETRESAKKCAQKLIEDCQTHTKFLQAYTNKIINDLTPKQPDLSA